MTGSGWSCTQPAGPCTRSDALAASNSYPAITLTVDVASNAAASVTNTASVAGGGDATPGNNTASDPTTVIPLTPDLTIAKTHSGNFTQGQTGATYTIAVGNAGIGPSSGTVTVTDTVPTGLTATGIAGSGWTCTQPSGPCTRSNALAASGSYPAITLTVNVAINAPANVSNIALVAGGGETNTANNTATDPTAITPVVAQGLRFVPLTPCRVADTRYGTGPFGGPVLAGNTSRDFGIQAGSCGIPANALAYSFNVTVAPTGGLLYLSMWPEPTVRSVCS
jgi:uncharacterized repeat protein (TIGR01451 family)